MVRSKEEGGLGFRDMEAFNLALLAKQAWRILIYDGSLMCRLMKARYFRDCSILQARVGRRPSFSWRSIYSGIEIIRRGVEQMNNDGGLIWKAEASGVFSVKSAYEMALRMLDVERGRGLEEQSNGEEGREFWSKVWRANVPNKVKHRVWRFFNESLPDCKNLIRRGVMVDNRCDRCGRDEESAYHLVSSCPWSKVFWSYLGLGKVWMGEIGGNAPDWLWWWYKKLNKEEWDKLLMGMWMLWRCRNGQRFGSEKWDQIGAADFVLNYWREFKIANKNTKPELFTSRYRWEKPAAGWFKINSDGSWCNFERKGGGGFVVRDQNGVVIYAECWTDNCLSSAL